ncbi:MAG TPA: sugar ABC transporter substrate-binding protein [Armatimonadota bacterium]|jgi:multiple sugar transport system substrate-binding protein
MLRIITLLALAALIVRVAMVANRRPAPLLPGQPVTIEMSVWGMPWEDDLYKRVYIPEFERRNPGIRVRFQNFEDYPSRLLLSHAGGIAPDVMRQNIDFAMLWVRKGVDLPLDSYIDGPDGIDRSDFLPVTWRGLRFQGRTYGVPQDINILALYYNKALFDSAGIRYPDSNWTWADLKRAAARLTEDRDHDGHPEVIGLDMGWGGGSFRPFIYQAGGRFWNADQTRAVFDSPEAIEALRYYKSLMRSYTLTRSSSVRGGLGPDKFFEQGKVALFIDGSWRTPALKKNAPNLRFGVAPLPRGKRPMSVSTSCFWAVSSQSRHPDAAWKLAKYLSSTEALTKYWQYLWVAPPARWSALRSPAFHHVTGAPGRIPALPTEAEWREKCAWIPEVLENGWTTVEADGPYSGQLMTRLNEAVDRTLLENADPAAALHEAARAANDDIRKARRTEATQ